jgi:tetratricopeptide (TPR) repeat protein
MGAYLRFGALLLLVSTASAKKIKGLERRDARLPTAVEARLGARAPAGMLKVLADFTPEGGARAQALVDLAVGLARYRLGQYRSAFEPLARAAQAPIAIADMAAFYAAETVFHQGAYGRARSRLLKLLKAYPHSSWRHRARMRIADTELVGPKPKRGLRRLRDALKTYPEYPHAASARYARARAEHRLGRLKRAANALVEIVRFWPREPLALIAQRELEGLAGQGVVPKAERPEDTLERCTRLRRRKYFQAALQGLQGLLTDPRAKSDTRRWARYQIARTLYQAERYTEALQTFEALEAGARGANWRKRALRWKGHTLEQLGRYTESAEALIASRGDPAVDAETASKLAWLYFNGAKYKLAAKWFNATAKFGGKWARSTRFWRVWLAYRLGDYTIALAGFKALQAGTRRWPHRYGYWIGRTLANLGEIDAAADTWRGIIASKPLSYYAYQSRSRMFELGRPLDPEPVGPTDPEARTDGEEVAGRQICDDADGPECAGQTPDAIEADAGVAAATDAGVPELEEDAEGDAADEPTPEPPTPAEVALDPLEPLRRLAELYGGALPEFVASYELAVLGETALAALKLRAARDEWLAYRRASRKTRRYWTFVHRPFVDYRPDSEVEAWGRTIGKKEGRGLTRARRALFSRRMSKGVRQLFIGAFPAVDDHHYLRRMLGREGRRLDMPPEEDANNAKWRRWYPRAFADQVTRQAAAHGLDPNFIWALMTVESSYNPWAISRVGARGLMQVMPHTGALVTERVGLQNFGPPLLVEPAVAIEQAAWYFDQLLEKFNGQLPLAIAGYNAGPHRVAAWLGRKGHLPMDEFIEEIPYTEARGYTKKVLRYLALYRRIYEGAPRISVSQVIDPDFRANINF